ncbi:MAG: ATP-dependent zinc metalloprotease FtsH [Armatimonadetes bacterium]|nr:ATP-dependent zinc metalloprotease FtsH [Armatimonadota bacterium]
MVNLRRDLAVWLVLFLIVAFALHTVQGANRRRAEGTREWSEFIADVGQGKVTSVKVFRPGATLWATYTGKDAPIRVKGPGDINVIDRSLKDATAKLSGIQVQYAEPSPWGEFLKVLLFYIAPLTIVAVLLVIYFMRSVSASNNQAMSFRNSRVKRMADHMPRKTFDDVAGVDEAKEELAEIVDFLRNADKYRKLGAEIPKGVLLMGPPGCGKTLLARAVAGEAGVPFFHISGSDFVEMFVGVGASRVRDLFDQAKANRPCIIFVDELDAVGRQRGAGLGGGHDEREQTVNQLLVEMDGFEPNNGIIVMAATNRPDILDPALLRPGRFDRRVVVDAPDLRGRKEILDLYLKVRPIADDVDADLLGRQTAGLTGADLYSIVNEASILAARTSKSKIEAEDFEESIQRVTMGRERRSRVLSPDERRAVAFHESGHALCGHFQEDYPAVHKITILPRGTALGYVMPVPDEERFRHTRAELRSIMVMALGGRVAEEVIYGPDGISTGAQSDLERVTELARAMVCEYGMSEEVGPRTMGRKHGPVFLGRDLVEDRNYSEEMAHVIDKEIRRMVDECYEQAQAILSEHGEQLHLLTEALLERETLDGAELAEIVGPGPEKTGTTGEAMSED